MIATKDLNDAIAKKHYDTQQWVTAFEVNEGTGALGGRRADAVALNTWPSQGYDAHGYEVKISRTDFMNEIKDASKHYAVSRFMDFWWIATPAKLLSPDELPKSWGLIELHESGNFRIKKRAVRNEAVETWDTPFTASFTRNVSQALTSFIDKIAEEKSAETIQSLRESLTKSHERKIEGVKRDMERRLEYEKDGIDEFKKKFQKTFGFEWGYPYNDARYLHEKIILGEKLAGNQGAIVKLIEGAAMALDATKIAKDLIFEDRRSNE